MTKSRCLGVSVPPEAATDGGVSIHAGLVNSEVCVCVLVDMSYQAERVSQKAAGRGFSGMVIVGAGERKKQRRTVLCLRYQRGDLNREREVQKDEIARHLRVSPDSSSFLNSTVNSGEARLQISGA